MKKIKIMFVIPSLAGGGAEVNFINILKEIDRSIFNIQLVLFERKGPFLTRLPPDIFVHVLDKKNKYDFFRIIFTLAWFIYPSLKPDIIFSSLSYTNIVVLLAKLLSFHKHKLAIGVQNCISRDLSIAQFKKLKEFLVKALYPFSNKIFCISEGVKKDLIKNYCISAKKTKVIYNSVDLQNICKLAKEKCDVIKIADYYKILACGRLAKQKNYPLLFEAFKIVLVTHKAKLFVLGEGEEEEILKQKATEIGVLKDILFLGFDPNPYKYMARCDVFILSSDWEGLGNVILEAMVCGIPTVSTNCPYGPGEVIENENNGLLVPVRNKQLLARAIIRLLEQKSLRKSIIKNASDRVQDFDVVKKIAEYENEFRKMVCESITSK